MCKDTLPNVLYTGMNHLEYEQRLMVLKLPSLEHRRTTGDMIETFKIIHGYYDRETVLCSRLMKLLEQEVIPSNYARRQVLLISMHNFFSRNTKIYGVQGNLMKTSQVNIHSTPQKNNAEHNNININQNMTSK